MTLKAPLLALFVAAAAHAQRFPQPLPPPGTPYFTEVLTHAGVPGFPGYSDTYLEFSTFSAPTLITGDGHGRFWVLDQGGTVIRELANGRARTVLMGLPGTGPTALVFNPITQSLFFSSTFDCTVRQVFLDGRTGVFAGTGNCLTQVDARGNQASFLEPKGLAVDDGGNLLVSDFGALRSINTAGVVTTLAQLGASMTAMALDGPRAKLYGTRGYTVYVVDLASYTGKTFAGGTVPGHVDGDAASARFQLMKGIEVDEAGNVFVTEGPYLRQITPELYSVRNPVLSHPTLVATVTNLNPHGLTAPHGLVRWGPALFFTEPSRHTVELVR